jgi:hypothetical protein
LRLSFDGDVAIELNEFEDRMELEDGEVLRPKALCNGRLSGGMDAEEDLVDGTVERLGVVAKAGPTFVRFVMVPQKLVCDVLSRNVAGQVNEALARNKACELDLHVFDD